MSTSGIAVKTRQNDPDLREVLSAAFAAHGEAQRIEALRIAASTLVALTAVIAAIKPTVAPVTAMIGAAWALAQGLMVAGLAQRATARAALVQEKFDVGAFDLEWNRVLAGPEPSPAEISRLARSYRGDQDLLTDYYQIPDLAPPADALACQAQNLAWGIRIRQRYARAVAAIVIGWCAIGILVGAALSLAIGDLLLTWYLPAMGALMFGAEMARRQHETVATRERVLATVQAVLDPPHGDQNGSDLVRRVQDVILVTRRSQARVPTVFFRRYRKADKADFERASGARTDASTK